jgi:hypothetical protein
MYIQFYIKIVKRISFVTIRHTSPSQRFFASLSFYKYTFNFLFFLSLPFSVILITQKKLKTSPKVQNFSLLRRTWNCPPNDKLFFLYSLLSSVHTVFIQNAIRVSLCNKTKHTRTHTQTHLYKKKKLILQSIVQFVLFFVHTTFKWNKRRKTSHKENKKRTVTLYSIIYKKIKIFLCTIW